MANVVALDIRPGGADRAGAADRTEGRAIPRSTATSGSRLTGLAIGSPMPMIRHRFGGHCAPPGLRLRAAFRHAPLVASPSAPREPRGFARQERRRAPEPAA